VPGVVCTVVPASGSRSSLLTTRLKSELGRGGRAIGVARPDRWDWLVDTADVLPADADPRFPQVDLPAPGEGSRADR
jgi:hypothetical protein